jgi:formylglycine-generating enzyme required for sulfatase activity
VARIDTDEICRRVLAIVGGTDEQISATDFAKCYHESFRISGVAKADSIIRDLRENRSHVDLSKCAYFSIGGSTGDEVEHVLRETEIRFGLLLEFDNVAAEWAQRKSLEVQNDLGKTLHVITGDATQKVNTCKQRLLDWQRQFRITGLIASAQAVLHELPTRSPNFSLVHFLGEVLWKWEPCLFYTREPCRPREWPENVRLAVSGLSSELLERLATYVGRFLRIDGKVHRAGPHEVLLSSTLAVELLHKLFYIEDFSHEIEERLTSIDPEEIVDVLESYLGPGSVQRTFLNTGSFAKLYNEFGVVAKDERGSKRLSPPISFVTIVGERRVVGGGSDTDSSDSNVTNNGNHGSMVVHRESLQGLPGKSIATAHLKLNAYLDGILQWGDRVPGHCWDNVDSAQLSVLSLSEIHVPLSTRERIATCEDKDGSEHRILPMEIETKGAKIDCAENWRLVPMLALETVAHYSRVLLIGRAGSGKTATIRHLAFLAASQISLKNKWSDRLLDLGWEANGVTPVRLTVKETRTSGDSKDLIWHLTSELHGDDDLARILQDHASTGRILFLMDDIDSIPVLSRPMVERGMLELLEKYPSCLWLFTSQTLNWGFERSLLAQWFRPVSIAPLSPENSREMVRSWWSALSGDRSLHDVSTVVSGIEGAIDRFGLGRLASSPEILSSLVAIYAHNEEGLPHSRLALYRNILQVIESRWAGHGGTLNVATTTNLQGEAPFNYTGMLSAVAASTAYAALRDGGIPGGAFPPALLYSSVQNHGPSDLVARGTLTQFIEMESGLFNRTADEELTFANRAIQEFLAASELRCRHDFPSFGSDLVRSDSTRWRNVLIMAAGLAGPDLGIAAVRAFCPFSPPLVDSVSAVDDEMWRTAWMAGEALAEIGLEAAEARPERREALDRVRAWLVQLVECSALSVHERHEVGMTLSRLGDPRPGVCSESLVFCLVSRGPVVLGGDGLSDAEPYEFDIPYDYWVSKYLVTNAQFAYFLDDNPEAHLPDDEGNVWSARRRVPDPGYANHPVVGVTYLDAKTYCEWLTVRLHERGELPEGYTARLPTEAEWMKVYRGGVTLSDGTTNPVPFRRYPWGMEWNHSRANLPEDQSSLSQTTSVGLYPTGVTPVGVLDAAGNVLEWTSTCWGGFDPSMARFGHPYNPHDGRENPDAVGLRIVRGGSWLFSEGGAKCACRLDPDRPFPDTGFRVFLVPARHLE